MRFDAILFDVDGTLIDSAPGIYKTFTTAFREMGVDPDGIDLSRYLGPPLRWSFGQHFDDPAKVEQAVETYRHCYALEGAHECPLFPGVRKMLERLSAAGLILGTATSKEKTVAEGVLTEAGIVEFFSLVSGSSLDASVDTKSAVIQLALKDTRLQGKRILMVGDRKDDMKGAADCGIPAAAVLYGYGSPEELEPWHPEFLASDCDALAEYILNQ